MLSQETLENGIVKVSHAGIFTLEHWNEYKQTMLDLLNASDERIYVLSDFSETERFEKTIVPEAGTAPHLTHPKLGLIVLLGGNALHNFILQITANRANKENRDSKMRVHSDFDRAIETLLHFRKIHAEVPPPLSSEASASEASTPSTSEASTTSASEASTPSVSEPSTPSTSEASTTSASEPSTPSD